MRASSKVRRKPSTLPILGCRALSDTATPIPTLPNGVINSSTTLPSAASGSSVVVGAITMSNGSPVRMRWLSAPAVSLITVTLCPVCFSKSGIRSSTTGLKAPAVRTLSVSADAVPRPANSRQRNEQQLHHAGVPIT